MWQQFANGLFLLLQETRKLTIFISLGDEISDILGGWFSVAAASEVKLLC